MEYENLSHVFEPVYDEKSQILILGTFPSVKSREAQFYYGVEYLFQLNKIAARRPIKAVAQFLRF